MMRYADCVDVPAAQIEAVVAYAISVAMLAVLLQRCCFPHPSNATRHYDKSSAQTDAGSDDGGG